MVKVISIILFFFALIAFAPISNAEEYNSNSNTKLVCNLNKADDGYIISYNLPKALFREDPKKEGHFFVYMDGFSVNTNPGDHAYLIKTDSFLLNSVREYDISILSLEYETIPEFNLTDSEIPTIEGHIFDSLDIYKESNANSCINEFYPLNIVDKGINEEYRGYNILNIKIHPIQYNPSTKELRVCTSLVYKITYNENKEADDVSSSKLSKHSINLDPLVKYSILNSDEFIVNEYYSSLSSTENIQQRIIINPEITLPVREDYRGNFLIITISKYYKAAKRLADWKCLLGYECEIRTSPTVEVSDNWTPRNILSEVEDYYRNNPRCNYLLILGDQEDVPGKEWSYRVDGQFGHVTDFYYGCMGGAADHTPDIARGRIPVKTLEEALIVIDKIIDYESNPPIDEEFYSSGLHLAYFGEDSSGSGREYVRHTLTSEEIRDYMISFNKDVKRLYWTDSSTYPKYYSNNFFGNGEEIPTDLQKPYYGWNTTADDIVKAINGGVSYILRRSHGDIESWRYPDFNRNELLKLNNGNMQPVIFSFDCLSGKFANNCLGEQFLKLKNAGCVAYVGMTDTSYSTANDILSVHLFDAMYPSPGIITTLPLSKNISGNKKSGELKLGKLIDIATKGLEISLDDSNEYSYSFIMASKEITHLLGDPSMSIYTSKPTRLKCTATYYQNTIKVNTNSMFQPHIALYDSIADKYYYETRNNPTFSVSDPRKVKICVSNLNSNNTVPCVIQGKDISKSLTILSSEECSDAFTYRCSSEGLCVKINDFISGSGKIVIQSIDNMINKTSDINSNLNREYYFYELSQGYYVVSLILNGNILESKCIYIN